MRELPIDAVYPNPEQPRQVFDQEALGELAQSIGEVGLLTPILVRPNGDGYEIVHGERRWRACKLAGLETIRAEVREIDDDEAYTASVVENEQREGLSPIETARALKRMMDAQELTQAGVARRISKSRTWVAQKLRLLSLPDDTQSLVKAGSLTEGHARQLLKLQTAAMGDKVHALADEAVSAGWSVARLQSEVDAAISGPAPASVSRDTFSILSDGDRLQIVYHVTGESLSISVGDLGLLYSKINAVSRDTMGAAG
jgi:ParB family chromosome partitioning protein